ncbi:MAG TPA: HAMP domain-containing histidine kinase [Bacteroidetes bacterium]|nr:HAMP domain-containing histidine kinase [Bacteroidota bacterium]
MKKRIYYAIAAIVVFFGVGAAFDFGISKDDHLATYVNRVERSLQKKESEVYSLLSDTGFIYRQLRGIDLLPSAQQEADLNRLLKLTSKKFNVSIYQNDSLVFWLNNQASLDSQAVKELQAPGEVNRLQRLPNGYFELIKRDMPGGLIATALLPIKKEYARESEFLPNRFETDDFEIPKDVFLSTEPTAFPIKTMEGLPRNLGGKELAWLDATGPAKDKNQLQLVFFIYILGFIALGVLVNDLAVLLVRKFQPWVGAAFMLASVAGIRWMTVELGFTKHFEDFQTFSHVFTDPILEGVDSLGELLINIVLLVWMMVFFNREFLVKEFLHPNKGIRFALTVLNFFAINLGILMVSSIFKSIVLDSSIVFDFENVFNLNSQSVLAMVGVVLLLLALFLFSHRMMTAIHKVGMGKNWRLAGMALALLLTVPVVQISDLHLPLWHFMVAASLYLFVFEFFVDVPNMTLGWLVGWLMLYAGLTSMLLYKYNGDKDFERRAEYARALASYEDSLAADGLAKMVHLFDDQAAVEQWNSLFAYFGKKRITREQAKDIFSVHLDENKYLQHNYEFEVYAFNRNNGSIMLSDQDSTLGQMETQFQNAKPVSGKLLRFSTEKSRDPGYMYRLSLPTDPPLLVFVKFKRSFSRASKVYTELLLVDKYKKLEELDDYDYGIYQDGRLVEERNKAYGKQLTDEVPPVGETVVAKNTSRRSELLYHAPADIVIKIGKDTGGYIKPLSLFSYVFTLLTIAVMFFVVMNYLTNALPGSLNFLRTTKPSLRNQFQFWVISMILFSFLGIGFVTVWYFQRSSNDYHEGRLDRKVTSALANVNYEIESWHREYQEREEIKAKAAQQIEDKMGRSGSIAFEQEDLKIIDGNRESFLIKLISGVHRLDVNIYNLNGDLITSSEEDIFKRGLVAPKMGAYAFQELTKLGFDRSNQEESIGNLHYTAAYLPLKNVDGETLAFMGIPYYARQRELRSDVTDFMSTLLNVYVFLLLIAGGLAIVIAKSITQPLSELRESLSSMRLGGNQQLVVYQRKDEIGDLVSAYNQAVEKIEESSRLLAQSERDSAWREMAKQIAHEIKNPLTPMKLSIQYLLHAYQSNPENAEPLLKRVSKTLIEQIDSLAQIANEFSNFAKMPQPENSLFSLNDLAASVHHLFANERTDMDISLDLPDKDFEVFADRNQFTRVLNNLFKNAIQAVPDDVRGIINLSLYEKDGKAVIRIKDNGSGIPPEIQKKVFTPNFSTKNSGTGLGLAICRSIVQGFNGDIYFETKEGRGTTFFVELPLVKVTEMEEVFK